MLPTHQVLTAIQSPEIVKIPYVLHVDVAGMPGWLQGLIPAVLGALIAGAVGLFTARAQIRGSENAAKRTKLHMLNTELYWLRGDLNQWTYGENTDVRQLHHRFNELPTWTNLKPMMDVFTSLNVVSSNHIDFMKKVDQLQMHAKELNRMLDTAIQSSITSEWGNGNSFTTAVINEVTELLRNRQVWIDDIKAGQDYIKEELARLGFKQKQS